MLLKMIIYLVLIGITAYIAACQYLAAAINASVNNRNMERVEPTKADYSILTVVFLIIGGLSIWGAKSFHYWVTTIVCVIITILACWFSSKKQPVTGCAIALIFMQVFVELATFVVSDKANLMFAVFALIKVILIIVIVGFGLYVNGSIIRDENNAVYRGKSDFNQSAANALDSFKKALAKEGAKEGIILVILVVIALVILFKLVLPSVV